MANKVDSNITGLSYAEESALKTLPGVEGADAVWHGLQPNSYSDFGGELATVARSPIDPSRQNKKGVITDLDASGGFNLDFTLEGLIRLMQGFFFADAREMASTKPLNGTQVTITGIDVDADNDYLAASGLGIFDAGMLILASGFGVAANNGLKTVVASAAGLVEVAEALAAEASPPAAAKLQAVGRVFPTADLSISVASNIVSMVSSAGGFDAMAELIPGAWIFIGGDAAGNRFVNNVGYARISSKTDTILTFDDVTWASPATEAGTGLAIRIFTGTVIKNENTSALIKRRSYNIERTLGEGDTDTQAEYLEGAIPNEFTLNVQQADKLTADLSFVALDNTYKSGEAGDEIKAGTRVAALAEDAFNTSSDLYRIKMAVHNLLSSSPEALFAYVSEAQISINNNVSPNKAVGVLGAFDASAGNFEVSGSITAFFSDVAAVQAVRNNSDVGFSMIGAARNGGFVFDIPLLGLGGGRLNVEKDAPITVPLEQAAAENANGYTLLYEVFPYLPTIAMPN